MGSQKKDYPNSVRKIREALMLSKAELARRANVSSVTIDRIEHGNVCRTDTKRKILLALGLKLTDKDRVFPEDGVAEDADAHVEELVGALAGNDTMVR